MQTLSASHRATGDAQLRQMSLPGTQRLLLVRITNGRFRDSYGYGHQIWFCTALWLSGILIHLSEYRQTEDLVFAGASCWTVRTPRSSSDPKNHRVITVRQQARM